MHQPADVWTRRPGRPAEGRGPGLRRGHRGLRRQRLPPLPVSQGRPEVLDSADALLRSAGGLHTR